MLELRQSPALIVAVLALVAAGRGRSDCQPDGPHGRATKKKVKKIGYDIGRLHTVDDPGVTVALAAARCRRTRQDPGLQPMLQSPALLLSRSIF